MYHHPGSNGPALRSALPPDDARLLLVGIAMSVGARRLARDRADIELVDLDRLYEGA